MQELNETLECRGAELTAINYDLHELSNRILHVQEDERKRLSRELHDQVGQALTVLKWNLGLLLRSEEVDATLLKQKLADSQTLLEETMDLVHRFAIELRPAMLPAQLDVPRRSGRVRHRPALMCHTIVEGGAAWM